MSNSIQTSVNWAIGYLGYSTPTVGPNDEPAITAANMTQQVILGQPFRWPWNRNPLTFNTVIGQQDYLVNVSDFGYAEIGTIANPSTGKVYPLSVLNSTPLGGSNDGQVPVSIAVQQHNIGVNVDFRFLGTPNAIYATTIFYQSFAPLMVNLTDTWRIPDYMSYIYNRGFLAHCMEAKGDPRAQQEKVNFAAALLGAAEGLTETEKNIFLAQYLSDSRDRLFSQLKAQQGVQARGT